MNWVLLATSSIHRGSAKDLTGRVHNFFKGRGVSPGLQKSKNVPQFLHKIASFLIEQGPLLGQLFIGMGAMHPLLEIYMWKCTRCTRATVAPAIHLIILPRYFIIKNIDLLLCNLKLFLYQFYHFLLYLDHYSYMWKWSVIHFSSISKHPKQPQVDLWVAYTINKLWINQQMVSQECSHLLKGVGGPSFPSI